MDLTLLEVSLDDAEITANAPFSGQGSAETDDPDELEPGTRVAIENDSTDDADDRGGAPIGAIVAVLVLVALAVLVKRRRTRDESVEVE